MQERRAGRALKAVLGPLQVTVGAVVLAVAQQRCTELAARAVGAVVHEQRRAGSGAAGDRKINDFQLKT